MGRPGGFSIIGSALLLGLAMPATAQFSDGFNFLKAVKDRKGDEVMTYLNKPGAPALSARDGSTGESALHIVTRRHDTTWLAFLLSRRADTAAKDNQGLTPLLVAAQTGDSESARLLIEAGANVNAINNGGETPLILAVHNRDLPMIQLLLQNRASATVADTIAGKTARDYASEDRRGAAIVKLLDEQGKGKPVTPTFGPVR